MIDHHRRIPTLAACAALALSLLTTVTASAQPVGVPLHREVGSLVFDGIPPADPALAARLAHYTHSRGATFLDWMADGSMLVATRFGDTEQVHRVATPLGMREQLTFYPDPIAWARAARSGTGFAFLKDQGGDDNAQVFYQSGTAPARQLTHGAFIHGSVVWAHDGKRIAFYGNDRDSLSYDVYLADLTANTVPQLLVGGLYLSLGMHREEQKRDSANPNAKRVSMTLDAWRDAWKR